MLQRRGLLGYEGRDAPRESIRFYLKGQRHPGVAKKLGRFETSRRTNALGKSEEHACSIAFQSAIIQLQKRTIKEGGDAVVDIRSITDFDSLESSTKFLCRAGNVVAHVALQGEVVRLK